MSSIPTSDPNDSDNVSHGNYDDLNETFYEFETSDNIANSSNVTRYTRSALYLLRNDSRSRRRPECALRTDLQNLGVWKFSTGNSNQNGTNNGVSDGAIGGGGQSGHVNTRAQRSPSTRSVSSDHSVNPSVHNLMQYKIDHRSISSSHLMPAFAKRRIVTSTSSQNAGGNASSYDGNSSTELRSETPSKGKDISYGGGRQRGKEHAHDYRQRNNDDHSTYLSPQRKPIGEHERERPDRTHEHDHHSSSASSPVSQTNSRHGHYNNVIQERRIGSGRLLPRDVNWDCRGQEKDKNQVNSTADKELSSHLLQPRNSGRFSDRSHDRVGYNDRRSFERRGGGSNDESSRDKYDNMNNSSSNTHNNRRFPTNELTNNAESSSSHQHQPTHGRGRRNHQYNDRNEEPEWFSSGPTSQHDTIELRGFEERDEHCSGNGSASRRNTASAARKSNDTSSSHANSSLNSSNQKSKEQIQNLKGSVSKDTDTNIETPSNPLSTNETDCATSEEKNSAADQVLERGGDNNNNDNDEAQIKFEDPFQNALKKSENDENIASKFPKEAELNFDAFLNPNLDPLNHTLMRGDSNIGNDTAIIGSSRFSRWFAPKTNGNDLQSTAGNDMQNAEDSNEAQNKSQTNTLMEFLQLSKLPTNVLPEGSNQHAGIPSVEELEARMRKMDNVDKGNENETPVLRSMESEIANNNTSHVQQPSREAFKKLLEQLGSGNKGQPQAQAQPQPQPQISNQMNILMQQPNHPVSVPQINMVHPGGLIATRLPQPIPAHILKNEEVKKFMQQQQMLHQHHQKQIHTVIPPSHVIQHHTMSPNNPQTGNEISMPPPHIPVIFPGQKRLEAQYLFQCVARGEISLNLLEQELNHPNTPSLAKEVIAAVLRESSRSATPSTGMSTNVPLPQPLVNTSAGLHQQHIHSPNQMGVPSQHGNIGLQNPQMTASVIVSGHPPDQRAMPQGLPTSGEINITERFVKPESLMKKMEQEQEQEWLKKVKESKEERQKQQQQHQQQKQKQKTQQKPLPSMINPSLNEIDAQQKSLQQMSMQQPLQTGHQQSHPSHTIQQQQRHINSPTPLAFTPTSVLRKMTADKDNSNNTHPQATLTQNSQNKLLAQTVFVNQNQQLMQQPQPRMILGGNHSQQQQQQQQQISNGAPQISPQNISQQQQPPLQQQLRNPPQMKWPTHGISQNMGANKSMGRPILKGPLTTPQPQQQQISQMTFASNIEFQQIQQQQQRLKNNRTPQHILNQPSQPFPQHPMQQQTQSHNMIAHVQQQHHQQQLFQQHQQRAMALQRQQQLQLQQQLHQHHPIQQQQPQQILDTSNRPVGIAANSDSNLISTTNTTGGIINYQRDGGLSPTSNQLAQWFSPELLAQASAGKLPLLNMNQALSLEEFERSIQHSSTAVHN